MKIGRFVLCAYQTNYYILRDNVTAKECLVIDTGLDSGELTKSFAWLFLAHKRLKLNF